MSDKIKILFLSNYSRALTGFGKNAKNVLQELHKDPEFEVVEAANGCFYGNDLRTPWRSYGTYPSNPAVVQQLKQNPQQERLAHYGNYCIDDIVKEERPDIVIGVEDVWAFDWAKKPWFDKVNTILWTTLDSSPILDQAYYLSPKVDEFLVWASFAENEMKEKGFRAETLHGAIDYSSFFPLKNRDELKEFHGLENDFVVGFVFKNQLRKSVPNLLEGFKLFQEETDKSAKLLLHTDWPNGENTWDIQKYIKEKELNPEDILATYICGDCKEYFFSPYNGEDINCKSCGSENSCKTKNNLFGVTEEQLNEIYNIMDVYCHPFTSGGQELPVQEAKAAGKITLVTEYSCGIDSCYPEDGGLPLKWVEYREPYTQFIKATTLPSSIKEQLSYVLNLSKDEKEKLEEASINCVKTKFSLEKTVKELKDICKDLGKTDWDFNFEEKEPNIDYRPDFHEEIEDEEWISNVYKNLFDKNFKEKDIEIVQGKDLIKKTSRQHIFNHLLQVAHKKVEEKNERKAKIEDFFLEEEEKRIAVVIPESAGDVLWVNSLISNLKNKYPDYSIYVVTAPSFFPMIDSHPDVANLIPYQNGMDSLLMWEGQGEWKGYVDICFLPFIGSQRHLNYLHNNKDV